MTDMHPHWHSTGADADADADARTAEPVKIHIEEQEPTAGFRGVSRAPAAVVGIAMVLVAGFWAMGGWGMFTGQTTPPAAIAGEIRITPDGPVPDVILAKPGETITWFNDDTGPHIVSSDTLKTSSGIVLYSSAIFPGSAYSITIAKTSNDATHEYAFSTNPDWKGYVVVAKKGCPPREILGGMDGVDLPRYDPCRDYEDLKNKSRSSAPSAPRSSSSARAIVQPVSSAPAVQLPPVPEPFPPTGGGIVELPENETPEQEPPANDPLPYNPYTVASDGTGLPASADTGAGGGKKPPSQPGSGPELWVTAFLALCAGGMLIRRHLVAFEATDEL